MSDAIPETPPRPKKKGPIRRLFIWSIRLGLFCFALSIFVVLFYRFVPVAYTPLMFWRSTASIFTEDKFVGIEKKWVPITQISKSMQQSVIKAEDYKFYQHNGFDFEAIEKALSLIHI
mgnify:FL=1